MGLLFQAARHSEKEGAEQDGGDLIREEAPLDLLLELTLVFIEGLVTGWDAQEKEA